MSVFFCTVTHAEFDSIDAISVPVIVAHCVLSTVASMDELACTSPDVSLATAGTRLLETDDIWEDPWAVGSSLVSVTTADEAAGVCCGGDTTSLKTDSILFAGSLGAAVPGEVDEFALPPAPGV